MALAPVVAHFWVAVTTWSWILCIGGHFATATTRWTIAEQANVSDHAGFITVNRSRGHNIFYWLFESQRKVELDPVILWIQVQSDFIFFFIFVFLFYCFVKFYCLIIFDLTTAAFFFFCC